MKLTRLLPFVAILLLVISCFLPWMTIESKQLTITGVNTTGTDFGKPGYFHFVWTSLYLIFLVINKVWSKRVAVGLAAFNIAWALRNLLLIPVCAGGECPIKQVGLYLLLAASILMFVAGLFYGD